MDRDPTCGFESAPEFPFGANVPDQTNGAPDPFDVNRLRMSEDDDAALGVTELIVTVPYRKPSKEQFFRVHPAPEYRCTGGLIELKDDDSEAYWVDPALWPHLVDEPTFGKRMLVTAVTRQGAFFLWGLRLPGSDGKVPPWVTIPLEAAKNGERYWTKMFWDQAVKQHRIKLAKGIELEPEWPSLTFREMLQLAFKDRLISSKGHPILRRLRGEV